MVDPAANAAPDVAAVRASYLAAQLHGDRREALRLVIEEALARGASALDVGLEVIQEAQRILSKNSLARELAINRIRDALDKSGVGARRPQGQP